jgi:Cu(I)/Ag(I) efflux system membrane fusion protein
MNRITMTAAGVMLAAAGFTTGWLLERRPGAPAAAAKPPAGDVLYWYDPMRPEVHFDKPGRSPFMEMELVPKYRDASESGGISISPQVTQNLGVRTAPAMVASLAPRVTVTGTVAIDDRRTTVIATRAAGWIEQLEVRAVGDPVVAGQRLAALYSPELLAAQEEYLLALRSDDTALIPAARRRLELLGVTAAQVARVAARGSAERLIDITAPSGGVVTDLAVRPGSALSAGAPIASIADLSRVWVLAEVPESQGAWLQAGQLAAVELAGAGRQEIEGRIDYLYPQLSAATRTVRLRITLSNEALTLRPGMTTRVTVQGPSRDALLVPTEALIRSGERTALIVAEGDGNFRPVAVVAGVEQGERTEIVSGIQAGERVVVSGQFLIDSEANLRTALDRLLPGAAQ